VGDVASLRFEDTDVRDLGSHQKASESVTELMNDDAGQGKDRKSTPEEAGPNVARKAAFCDEDGNPQYEKKITHERLPPRDPCFQPEAGKSRLG
jgi:hypothetical protein